MVQAQTPLLSWYRRWRGVGAGSWARSCTQRLLRDGINSRLFSSAFRFPVCCGVWFLFSVFVRRPALLWWFVCAVRLTAPQTRWTLDQRAGSARWSGRGRMLLRSRPRPAPQHGRLVALLCTAVLALLGRVAMGDELAPPSAIAVPSAPRLGLPARPVDR